MVLIKLASCFQRPCFVKHDECIQFRPGLGPMEVGIDQLFTRERAKTYALRRLACGQSIDIRSSCLRR